MTEAPVDMQVAFLRALRGGLGPLPPGPQALPRAEVAEVHRRRLVAGMAQALSQHGMARTTVADVVREAQVSRRTFYELFADKTSCLLATYDACAELNMSFVEAAVSPSEDRTWEDRIAAGVRAYFEIMDALPGLARVLIVEMPSAGPEAMARVHGVHGRFAMLLTRLAAEHRADLPPGADVDDLLATAIVGGINELVLQALAAGDPVNTPERLEAAMRLVVGAMQALPADAPAGA